MGKTNKQLSGADTLFSDKNGKVIKVHDYVKDAEGNRYYINSYCQAVPEEGDAPAEELSKLLDRTDVFVMSIEEVLDVKKPEEHKRRGARRKKDVQAQKEAEQAKVEAEARKAEEEAEAAAREAAAEEAKKEAARAARAGMADIHPVTEEMILSVLPDNVLANELRRRGYTLCAVRPSLIEL